jgi:hypothetical protein
MDCCLPRLLLMGESVELLLALVPDILELKVGTTPSDTAPASGMKSMPRSRKSPPCPNMDCSRSNISNSFLQISRELLGWLVGT